MKPYPATEHVRNPQGRTSQSTIKLGKGRGTEKPKARSPQAPVLKGGK